MIKKHKTIIIGILALIAFAGFGCKNEDTVADDTAVPTEPTQEVTFAPPEPTGTGTEITVPDTVTQEVEFPTNGTDTTSDTATDDATSDTGVLDVPVSDDSTADPKVTNEAPTVAPVVEEEVNEEDTALKLARTLAEIFGTFTNKDKELYGNYKSMLPYATDKVGAWLNGKIDKGSTADLSAPFYGITTRAISAGVLESGDTAYKILVTTEREEISEESNTPNKLYQLIEIDLIKEGDDWKLNGTYWQ